MISAVTARRIAAQHDDNVIEIKAALFMRVIKDVEKKIIVAANQGLYNTHYCFTVDDYASDIETHVVETLISEGYEAHCYGHALAVLWKK